MASLYERRLELALDDRAFYEVVRAREHLVAEDFVGVVAWLPAGVPPRRGIGLLLSGIVPEPMELFDRIADAGAYVAADDLGCGWRRVYPPSTLTDPYERIADRLLAGPPDPTRGSPIAERADDLLARLRSTGARGVLVYDVKFCEPELFDVPLLRERLAAAGYPLLHVEVELSPTLTLQTITRVEAFVETLR